MLFMQLLERMIFISLAAMIFSQSPFFQALLRNTSAKNNPSIREKALLIAFFTTVSIIGTYAGINVDPGAIANTRPVGAIVAGYFGGPVVGLTVGLLAGAHRYTLGGFTALACGLSTIAEGYIGSLARKLPHKTEYSIFIAFLAGLFSEVVQMIIILLIAKPFEQSVQLEQAIAFPMVVINSCGVAIFVIIIKNARENLFKLTAVHSQRAMNIAKRTIPYMRQELTPTNAKKVCEIICDLSRVEGAFIGDQKGLVSFHGDTFPATEVNHFLLNYNKNPKYQSFEVTTGFYSHTFYCVPFMGEGSGFLGVLGLKVGYKKDLDDQFALFAQELGELLSTQIELYRIHKLEEAVSAAELKALRAQMHPHFLFNTLNTISYFCRTDPDRARSVLLELSKYLRTSLDREEELVMLQEEIDLIHSYFSIEEARFGNKIQLNVDVPTQLLSMRIPVFVLQPLVENAIHHGISKKPKGGLISVRITDEASLVRFEIQDDGVGMSCCQSDELKCSRSGIGLKNIHERIRMLYGEKHQLTIQSSPDKGTLIRFTLPKEVPAL